MINLSPEQTAYLKGLESKKKQRKFLLDCMIENVIDESANKQSEELCCMCKIHKKEENSNRCISCNAFVKHCKDNKVYPLGSRQLINRSAKDELKSKLEKAFNASKEYHHIIVDGALQNKLVYNNFEEYYKTLNL